MDRAAARAESAVRAGERQGLGPEPQILIVATDDEVAEPLTRGLDALGWRTVTARSAQAGEAALKDFDIEAAIVDGATADTAPLKLAARPRALPVLRLGQAHGQDAELVMSGPPHPAQIALRLEQLIRAAVSEEEFELRRDTFAARDAILGPATPTDRPLRILAAGAPDKRFLALSNALTSRGAIVVAAPTPYTAFDYLHETAFDAAVLWGAADHAPALSIAAGMRRNTRLFHIPAVLYLRESAEINLGELYNRGLADVAAADTSEEETAERILALASTYRRHQAIRKALENARGSGLMDSSTGLFTRELFATHLARIVQGARRRRRPLSVAILRVPAAPRLAEVREGGWLDRAMPQIGAMVSRLVRAEDTAARLAPETFALALPATRGSQAKLAAERIAAVIGCTAFDAGPERSPFVVEFDVGVAELQPDEEPADLVERASLTLRPTTA